jgi:hypothetical protein
LAERPMPNFATSMSWTPAPHEVIAGLFEFTYGTNEYFRYRAQVR